MLTTINITNTFMDMNRFNDRNALKHFYADKGIDGIELMLCGNQSISEKITCSDVIGIHLSFFPSWLDFWIGNRKALNREYGEEKIWREYYGGYEQTDLLKRWEQELEIAHRLNVKYVVFHVSESTLEECVTYRFRYTDEQVCFAAAEIINCLLKDKPYQFYFLAENLWWSGLTLTNPEVTQSFLDRIHYERKGIMLDTGHLIHTNNDIDTQEEALQYIRTVLQRNGELCRYIKGVHLNQSISGKYVKDIIAHPPKLALNYEDRLMQIYPHIFKIDYHKPFTADGVSDLIQEISPQFLTFELITNDNQEHEDALKQQLNALKRNGGFK